MPPCNGFKPTTVKFTKEINNKKTITYYDHYSTYKDAYCSKLLTCFYRHYNGRPYWSGKSQYISMKGLAESVRIKLGLSKQDNSRKLNMSINTHIAQAFRDVRNYIVHGRTMVVIDRPSAQIEFSLASMLLIYYIPYYIHYIRQLNNLKQSANDFSSNNDDKKSSILSDFNEISDKINELLKKKIAIFLILRISTIRFGDYLMR